MKKSIKQIALILLALAAVMSLCFSLISCDGEESGGGTTTEQKIPGIGTSDSTLAPLGTGGTGSTAASTTASNTSGTSGSTSTPTTPPPAIDLYINPLTGLRTDYNASGLRPIAVVVDNIKAAYAHQTGLSQADIIYETLVSPGISRITAIISDYSALSAICNIREAYVENIDIAGSHNAIMVSHGGASHGDFVSIATARLGGGWNEALGKNTYGYVNTAADVGFTVEGGAKYGTIKYYSKTRAEFMQNSLKNGLRTHYYTDGLARADLGGENGYDTILTTEGLMAVLNSKFSGFNQAGSTKNGNTKGFDFVAEGREKVMSGASAGNINIAMKAEKAKSTKYVAFSYDAAGKVYLRSQDGAAHKDVANGKHLSFTNVITLFTDVTGAELKGGANVCTTKVTGEGTGYYFYGGKAMEIKWSKPSWSAELTLTDMDGNALEFARGKTYIGYVGSTDSAAVSFS